MAYSAEVVKRARARLAQEKENRESENRQHLAQAYAKVPRIREIDMLLRRTMAQAAQAAFLQGSDGREMMETVRQQNLELQQERAILAMENFEAGYLDDSPICDHCGGSGYIGSNMCECLRELCRQEQKKDISILSNNKDTFNQFRLEYYPDRVDRDLGINIRSVMERTLQTCRQYATFFTTKSENLLLSGDTGLGKTFMSACIARTVADRGYSVVYESAGHLLSNLERAKFSSDEMARDKCKKYNDSDLLIIDDLGTEMPGQFTTAALYNLINDRLLYGKPMIISTNLTVEEMVKRYSPQIASRLRGSFKRVAFVGEDIRVLKNRGY
ncbi:MAG: ATP-binding protein [Oscillospiraceae bacterium]|nr:ATP-binding protein [Oscillospiraceae bacterium]